MDPDDLRRMNSTSKTRARDALHVRGTTPADRQSPFVFSARLQCEQWTGDSPAVSYSGPSEQRRLALGMLDVSVAGGIESS